MWSPSNFGLTRFLFRQLARLNGTSSPRCYLHFCLGRSLQEPPSLLSFRFAYLVRRPRISAVVSAASCRAPVFVSSVAPARVPYSIE
jgi:hypothetical protein